MNLHDYCWKNVEITGYEGNVYVGFVDECYDAEDSFSGTHSISVAVDYEYIEFSFDDIKSIRVIDYIIQSESG